MHSSKQSDFERDYEGKNKHGRKCFQREQKYARKCFRSKKKHARAVISSAQWPRGKKKHARALSSLQKASSSSDFERPAAKKQARAVISSAQWLRSTLEQWFRALNRKSCACAVFSNAVEAVWPHPTPTGTENLLINIYIYIYIYTCIYRNDYHKSCRDPQITRLQSKYGNVGNRESEKVRSM